MFNLMVELESKIITETIELRQLSSNIITYSGFDLENWWRDQRHLNRVHVAGQEEKQTPKTTTGNQESKKFSKLENCKKNKTIPTAKWHLSQPLYDLAGSSLSGTKLHLRQSRLKFRQTNYRGGAVVAKYGDKSVYFDLDDIGNTTGQWDLYGSDAPSPYNSLQSKFFETFAAPFTKRGVLLKFLILGGGSTLSFVSSQATGDVLPIVKGPQLTPKPGPRGRI